MRSVGSTIPANGDINPYGIVEVPTTTGTLVAGDSLVSNFNDKANVQGTGTTIIELTPQGKLSVFATIASLPSKFPCPGGIGLGTALGILPGGYVVVGSIPAAGPSGAPSSANPNGCLIVLNSSGSVVETWSNVDINGPWDLTISSSPTHASIFVANALSRTNSSQSLPQSGTCTVTRIDVSLSSGIPQLAGTTVVGSGFAWQVNHATFVLSPTGLALSKNGTLYVVQTLGNHVTKITNALTRSTAIVDGSSTLSRGGALNAPLGALLAPNGNLIVVNGNDGNAVEITPSGRQIKKLSLVPNGAGTLFGIALTVDGRGLIFVNDGTNSVDEAPARTR